jgi:hypothetical protein
MRVIALIDDPGVVRRILEHLGRWAPEPAERGPPAQAPEWPPNAVIPITYHPVPDIAQRSARLKRARTSASHCAIDSRGSGFAAFRPNRDCKRPRAGATFHGRDARRGQISSKPLLSGRRAKGGRTEFPIVDPTREKRQD